MAYILIVDDEQDLIDLVSYNLVKDGHEVGSAPHGAAALARIRERRPDALILDLMMPHVDGYQVLREIRARPEWQRIPVIMLTARDAVEDRIRGLELGADDYLSKPFSPKELLLRLRGVLRRTAGGEAQFKLGPFKLERETLRLDVDGRRVDLTATEFKLMLVLLQRAGQIQQRDNLLREVWGYKDSTLTRTLDTHVKRLREKLGEHGDRILTVRGVGFVLKPENPNAPPG
jgi:two-component system, OmpR family, phosphate regulon response regulator PhoB